MKFKAKIPVLVDFYSNHCPPCRMLEPILEELEGEKGIKGKIKFVRVDVDENQELAAKYRVMSVPTLILFKEGKEAKRIVGLRKKEDLSKELKAQI